MTHLVLLSLVSYLLGSVPLGYLLARARGVDLRSVGSGNVGATNTARALGLRWGLVAFAFDFGKGFVPAMWFPRFLPADAPLAPAQAALVFGVAAVAGHVFPLYFGFRGGKGVATSAGFLAAVAPGALGLSLLVFAVVLAVTRIVSLSSILAAIAFPVALVVSGRRFEERADRPLLALGVVLAAAIVVLHRKNLVRLLRGEEPRLGSSRGVDR